MTICSGCVLSKNICSGTSSPKFDLASFAVGETIFEENTLLKGVYCIKQGICKIVKLSGQGSEQIIQLLGKDTLLGIRSVVNSEKTNLKAVALTPVKACFLPAESLEYSMRYDSSFSTYLIKTLASYVKATDNRIVAMGQNQVHERLAMLLWYLNREFGVNDNGELNIYLKRAEMANFIGTATESVIRALKSFEHHGWIKSRGKALRITDKEALNYVARGFAIASR
jgi:CRP-like cAMP-binding protein